MLASNVPGGTKDESVLTLTRRMDNSPSNVWNCLTKPECFKVWWSETMVFDPGAGARFSPPWVDPTGRDRIIKAEVTAFHPPRGMVMVWADEEWTFDTIVSVWIEPDGNGSTVTLEHQGWHAALDDERDDLMLHHQAGWSDHLTKWASHAEGLNSPRTDDEESFAPCRST